MDWRSEQVVANEWKAGLWVEVTTYADEQGEDVEEVLARDAAGRRSCGRSTRFGDFIVAKLCGDRSSKICFFT